MLASNTLIQNRYRIIECIGQGGMGAVYETEDEHLRTTVALKHLLISGPQPVKAFEREARLLAQLHHPALPRVTDYFSDDNGQFLVMDFIPGADLAEMLEQRGSNPFPPAPVLEWADQLLTALEYLHIREPPILHRDIKPHNIKLTQDGRVMLLDFGLAKRAMLPTTHTTRSSSSLFAYTPQYAPLELIQRSNTDPRSDLYSLAATLHTLLTGEPPIDTMTRAAAIINGEPDPQQPAHMHNPHIPAALGAVVLQAMAMRANERPSNAGELRSALHATQQTQQEPRGATATTITQTTHMDTADSDVRSGGKVSTTHPAHVAPASTSQLEHDVRVQKARTAPITVLTMGIIVVVMTKWFQGLLLVFGLSLALHRLLLGKRSQALFVTMIALMMSLFPFTNLRTLLPLIILGSVVSIGVGVIIILKELLK